MTRRKSRTSRELLLPSDRILRLRAFGSQGGVSRHDCLVSNGTELSHPNGFDDRHRRSQLEESRGRTKTPASINHPAIDPVTLAKYNRNHNGKLDSDEVAALEAHQAKLAKAVKSDTSSVTESQENAIQLSPFEVAAGADKAYPPMSSTSGTR
jgi:hypothetical protein